MTLDEFRRRVGVLEAGGAERVLHAALERAGLRGTREAKLSLTGSGKQRTGNLRSSIRHAVRPSMSGWAEVALVAGGSLGPTEVAYARMQEEGGTVAPKRAQYLSIPVGPLALTPAGVSRYPSPRAYPGELDFIPTPRGGVLVDHETGELVYALVRQVTVKGRHYMRAGLQAAAKGIGPDITRGFAAVLKGAK